MSESGVLEGPFFLDGDTAIAEGAICAGCRFFAGYPITPATEIAERMAARLPEVGGVFIQMEDELASMGAVVGAAWGGARAMTATSGPGVSLMSENIGLAIMTETPCVVVNVQRGGPSTGLPTLASQSDMMQARWGSHGDYEIIALAPGSPQVRADHPGVQPGREVPHARAVDDGRGSRPYDRKSRHPASRADTYLPVAQARSAARP